MLEKVDAPDDKLEVSQSPEELNNDPEGGKPVQVTQAPPDTETENATIDTEASSGNDGSSTQAGPKKLTQHEQDVAIANLKSQVKQLSAQVKTLSGSHPSSVLQIHSTWTPDAARKAAQRSAFIHSASATLAASLGRPSGVPSKMVHRSSRGVLSAFSEEVSEEYETGYQAGLDDAAHRNTVEVITPPGERPIAINGTETKSSSLAAVKAATSKIGAITDMLKADAPEAPPGTAEDDAAEAAMLKTQMDSQQMAGEAQAKANAGMEGGTPAAPTSHYSPDGWMQADVSSPPRYRRRLGSQRTAMESVLLPSEGRNWSSFFPMAEVKAS